MKAKNKATIIIISILSLIILAHLGWLKKASLALAWLAVWLVN